MLRGALLESLELLRNPPAQLDQAGPLRAWRCQVWVRLSYLLMHCSTKCSGNSPSDLLELARRDNLYAQRLLGQERQAHLHRIRTHT
jgi:hypothetical protein